MRPGTSSTGKHWQSRSLSCQSCVSPSCIQTSSNRRTQITWGNFYLDFYTYIYHTQAQCDLCLLALSLHFPFLLRANQLFSELDSNRWLTSATYPLSNSRKVIYNKIHFKLLLIDFLPDRIESSCFCLRRYTL